MIQLLPNEIIQIIIEQLSQSDCFHLCIVNKNFNELCLPKLYRSITIDSKLTIYHNELNFTNDLRKLPSNIDYYNNKNNNNSILKPNFTKITIIKTYYGLKRFFKTLLNNLNLINLINYLEISKNLPDNFIEIEFIKNLKDYLFPNLNNLKFLIFHYQSCFLNLNDLILSLPEFNRNVPHNNSNNLLKIDCDFLDLNNEKRRKLSSPSSLSRLPKNQIYNKLKSLNQLTLINFQNGENLKNLNLNNNLELINNLKFLELSRLSKLTFPINFKIFKSIGLDFNLLQENFNKFFYNNMTNSLNNNDFNSILSNNPIPLSSSSSSNGLIDAESVSNNYYETDIIKCLFGNTQTPPDRHHKKLKLKKLKLDSITVCLNDFKILNLNIDLLELEILELLNVSEIMNDDSNNSPNSLRNYLLTNSDNNNNDDDDGDFPVPDNMDPEEAELLAIQMLSRNETNSLIPRRRRLDDSDFFLFKISPFLKNLKILTIDFYNDFKDFTPILIKNIDHLIQLYININWNQSRDNLFNKSYDELLIDYFKNLLKHSLTLKILIIDSKNESIFNSSPIFQRSLSSSANSSNFTNNKDNLEIKDLNINILSKFLPNFKNLVNLRLPINENCLLSFLENNLMFLNNLKFIEIIFPQVNSYSSFNLNDSHSSSNNANNNDSNYSANNSLISNTHAHLGTLVNPIPTSDINSMNFNYNSDTTLLNSIFNDDDPDENNSNSVDETVLEFNRMWQKTSLKSKLDIDTQKNKMNFKDLHQISLIFKKFIGIKSEIENSFNNRNHNNSSCGSSSSFNVMKYQSSLKYLKIFNVIICVDDIKNIKFKTNSLDEWFNLKLTGNL